MESHFRPSHEAVLVAWQRVVTQRIQGTANMWI